MWCHVKKIILSTSKVLLVIAIVAGWYYLRNWVMLGKPFIGGWDPSRGVEMAWWQDPGFRGVSDFTSFGYALIYPIYAATAGFWDAIYSTLWADGLIGSQSSFETKPPWNYQFVFVTVCLSIIPTISLISAIVFPVRLKFFGRETTAIIMLCGLSVLLYTFAILYMYLKLPIYSTAKASYSLGLLPCYALLIAFGLANLLENEKLKKLILGFFAWWGFSSYLGYFSIGNATL